LVFNAPHGKEILMLRMVKKLVFNAPHGKGESVLDQCLKVFMCGILDPKSPESSLKKRKVGATKAGS
jgi:hypothetical protein